MVVVVVKMKILVTVMDSNGGKHDDSNDEDGAEHVHERQWWPPSVNAVGQNQHSRHVWRRRRQEFICSRRREGGAGFIGVGAGALVQAVGAEAFPRANAAIRNSENQMVVKVSSLNGRLGRMTQAAPKLHSSYSYYPPLGQNSLNHILEMFWHFIIIIKNCLFCFVYHKMQVKLRFFFFF